MADELIDDARTIERYELRAEPVYRFDATRREFVQVLGAGLMVVVSANKGLAQRRGRGRGRGGERAVPLSQRLHIDEEGTVTLFTSKVEVGQGSRTQITMAAAEELRLPVERIRLVMADTERCPDDGGTAGSRTTPSTVPAVRAAAATARRALIELAADRLDVDASGVEFSDGVFTTHGDKQLALGDLAADDKLAETLAASPSREVELTRVDAWNVLGTSVPKVDGRDVVMGKATFPSDVRREGMLYGKVLRPVSYNATLKNIDLGPAENMQGVTVVRDGNFVGCAAATSWEAAKAIDSLYASAEWESPTQPSSQQLYDHLREHARPGGGGWGGGRENSWGDGIAGLERAEKKLNATYNIAYIQHAPMEPRAAVAEWEDGKLTVWTGSQQPGRVQGELAEAFGLEPGSVRVIVPDTGGGFGGRHTGEAAVEAARLAKAAGRPVSLRWTREEEFTWAYFRPAGVIDVQAALDKDGKLTVWDMTNINSGGSALDTPYDIPHGRTRFLNSDSPLRQGSYRALASTANAFARESAMDELAEMSGTDPLEFRLAHLADGRLKDVLLAAAEKFNWRERRAERREGRGVGLGCGTEKGSFTAACAEVEIANGQIRVLEVCQAFECGAIHNPRNVRAQVEGCLVMGLGGALFEEIKFENGRIQNPFFAEYRVPRMSDLPKLEIVLVDRHDLASVGAGETPIIGVAPAVANAVFHAVGVRSRSLPLRLPA